jgi:hypothetical protein
VWHCSVRNHETDRVLSDQQWQHIAGEIMAAVGLAPHGDPDAVRWVAVRHDDYGIHIVATLVRQDGHTAWAWNDKPKARTAANDLEQRYGLRRVAPADRTAHRRPGAAELNKTRRKGHEQVPRDRLRREVRAAAAAAASEPDFFNKLSRAGLLVKLRHSTIHAGEVTGYAVGLPGHHTAAGNIVWYGGGRLAPDLTLPKLRHRWHHHDAPPRTSTGRQPTRDERAETFHRAAHTAQRAAEELRNLAGAHPRAASAVAQAAADVLTSTARAFESRRGGPLAQAAEAFDRAARLPHGQPPPRHRRADQLRAISRLISVMGRLTGENDTTAALQLVLHLAALAEHLADLRHHQQRLHQVRDARHAADTLRSFAADATSPATLQPPLVVTPGSHRTRRAPSGGAGPR